MIIDNSLPVFFLGRLNRTEMFKKYKSTVLVFPSYIETVGLPLLEAKACGSFILAADCIYAHDALKDYKNVRYFDPFDYVQLSILLKGIFSLGEHA